MAELLARPAHRHRRLSSPQAIRVLSLRPSLNLDEELTVDLTEVEFSNGPAGEGLLYEALSYVWGTPIGSEPITCDGQRLLVTPNCASALRHLRQDFTARILWVDSICIDQSKSKASTQERNAQVQLMGAVYARATRTLCWFGPGREYTGELFSLLDKIGRCPSERGLRKLLQFDERLRQAGALKQDASSLDSVFCHPWHSRIWTVQELVYSKDCKVVCGHYSLDWTVYSAAAGFLVYESFVPELDEASSPCYVGIDLRNTLRGFVQDSQQPGRLADPDEQEDLEEQQRVYVASCLTDVIQLQASDPRDKIYGLHSLLSFLNVPLPSIDYNKTIPEVYQDAALAMVWWSQSLQILGDACGGNRMPQLPSWVPDWSDNSLKLFVPQTDATNGSKFDCVSREEVCPSPGELAVKGFRIGKLIRWPRGESELGDFPSALTHNDLPIFRGNEADFPEEIESARLRIAQIKYFRALYRFVQKFSRYHQGMSPREVMLEVMTQGSSFEGYELSEVWINLLEYPDTEYDMRVGRGLAESWKARDVGNTRYWNEEVVQCASIIGTLLLKCLRLHGKIVETQEQLLDASNIMCSNLASQKAVLVKCSTGNNALSTTLSSARIGDIVVLLQGARYPVTLRQSGSRWQLIGPAYVLGYMSGEGWHSETNSSSLPEKFILV